jgi:arylsulfatase A-like enzyme
LVQSIDIFPTILDFLGLKREPTLQGNSLSTILFNPGMKSPDYEEFGVIEGNYGKSHETAFRTREWKFIYKPYTYWGRYRIALDLAAFYLSDFVLGADSYFAALSTYPPKDYNFMYELYNVKTDPDEQNNLFYKRPELGLSMKKKLNDWIKKNSHKERKQKKKDKSLNLKKSTVNRLKSLGYIN